MPVFKMLTMLYTFLNLVIHNDLQLSYHCQKSTQLS